MRLYLDMDGVLMDFAAQAANWGVKDVPVYVHKSKHLWTVAEIAHDAALRPVMEFQSFWTTMKPMADAKVLWRWCAPLNPSVLTATPANEERREMCASSKLYSIRTHFDSGFTVPRFIACLRSEKAALSHPGAILVDDNPGNCAEWNAAGGTAILHKDAMSTIRVLREIFGEP